MRATSGGLPTRVSCCRCCEKTLRAGFGRLIGGVLPWMSGFRGAMGWTTVCGRGSGRDSRVHSFNGSTKGNRQRVATKGSDHVHERRVRAGCSRRRTAEHAVSARSRYMPALTCRRRHRRNPAPHDPITLRRWSTHPPGLNPGPSVGRRIECEDRAGEMQFRCRPCGRHHPRPCSVRAALPRISRPAR